MQNILLVASGLILISFALLYLTKIRTRIEIDSIPMPTPTLKQPTQPMSADTTFGTSIEKTTREEEILLEEAELYANLGLPETSIKILKEIIQLHSSNPVAWFLLLSCYSSLGKTNAFEKAAREFRQRHTNSQLWNRIKALGRTLDANNPLYAENNKNGISAFAKLSSTARQVRSIGEILKETGALTDLILQHYLSRFNPNNHGRFGGFLLKNKVITLKQLNHALMLQQSALA